MATFTGFKQSGMQKIADTMGYKGPMTGFPQYLNANPDKQQMMNSYVNKAMLMAKGGYVRKFQTGGLNTSFSNPSRVPGSFDADRYLEQNPDLGDYVARTNVAGTPQGAQDALRKHYREYGFSENRPGAWVAPANFDARAYYDANPDVREAGERAGEIAAATDTASGDLGGPKYEAFARDHYERYGGREGRPLTRPTIPSGGNTTQPCDGMEDPPTLTPTQVYRRDFYASTPEVQQRLNEQNTNYVLPLGNVDTGAEPITSTPTEPITSTPTEPEDDQSVSPQPPTTSTVNTNMYLANRPDVARAIQEGNIFDLNPADLEGLTPEARQNAIVQAHFNIFGEAENLDPTTGLPVGQDPTVTVPTITAPLQARIDEFRQLPDRDIENYLLQNPDLFAAFSPTGQITPDILNRAKEHFAQFGAAEISEGGRPTRLQGLSPTQVELYRFANPELSQLSDIEIRQHYLQHGHGEIQSGARNTNISSRILSDSEARRYIQGNPDLASFSLEEAKRHFIQFGNEEMLTGNRPRDQVLVPEPSPYEGLTSIADISAARLERPALPSDTRLRAETIAGPGGISPRGTILNHPFAGMVLGDPQATAAPAPTPTGAGIGRAFARQVMDTTETEDDVRRVTEGTAGATKTLTKAKPTKEELQTSRVANLEAASDTDFEKADAATRAAITDAEKVTAASKAQAAATFVEQIVAESTNPTASATVAGQLTELLQQFDTVDEFGNPVNPPWAAGAMRAATAEMVRRGLGSSSIASQAIVQAAMESALPIAQADAQIQAQFEAQNLSNKQAMAAFYAQQRAAALGQEYDQEFQTRVTNAAKISDIADKNFTAEQQVVLENSRTANTMDLQNLSNSQALVMAEAAALSQIDITNLNNRQQAAVQESQAFLQKEMAELSNDQQTTLFNSQQRIQSLFTDAAADNARKQFNATSDNQVRQLMSNLITQTSQFNATQRNSINQFNAGESNTIDRFNQEIKNQRDQFNAQNRLVIDQANAVWRRQIATSDTAAQNRVNELNASAMLDISNTAYNDLWQQYADVIEFAYRSAENELDRAASLAEANLNAQARRDIAAEQSSSAAGTAIGKLIGTLGSAFIGSKFKG